MGNDSDEDRFGKRVRDERLLNGWTQAQLAEKLLEEGIKLHPSAIAKIEDRGGAKPRAIRLEEAAALARVFGRRLDEMYEDDEHRVRSIGTRLFVWLNRLEEELADGSALRDEIEVLLQGAEDPERRGHLEGFFVTDRIDRILEVADVVETAAGQLRHPSRTQVWYGGFLGNEA
ncbi:hypothetical protein ES5_09867 [Dietzia cinnamea P4]|nr:hypothetical protein ES5_09867 [Dietzia cinnamea P4]